MIRFGTAGAGAGLCESVGMKTSVWNAVQACALHELTAMEVEFVQGVKMSLQSAKDIGELARSLGVRLSVHAPYWINLASEEPEKVMNSRRRILDSCHRAHFLGAKDVVFHAAFYGKRSKEEVTKMVEESIFYLKEEIKNEGWNEVNVSPEYTGKTFQWGDLHELAAIRKKTGCSFCIDFAHVWARNQGNVDWQTVFYILEQLELEHLHSHFSGIEFRKTGERRHLEYDGFNPDFKPIAREILKRNMNVTIISESPVTWQDSLKCKAEMIGLLEEDDQFPEVP